MGRLGEVGVWLVFLVAVILVTGVMLVSVPVSFVVWLASGRFQPFNRLSGVLDSMFGAGGSS